MRGRSVKGVQKGKREGVAPGVEQTYLTRVRGRGPRSESFVLGKGVRAKYLNGAAKVVK